MPSADDSPAETIKKEILTLDDRIETLVQSLDADQPEAHPEIYAEIEKAHEAIAHLREKVRRLERNEGEREQ